MPSPAGGRAFSRSAGLGIAPTTLKLLRGSPPVCRIPVVGTDRRNRRRMSEDDDCLKQKGKGPTYYVGSCF